jgi:hypothetical protein
LRFDAVAFLEDLFRAPCTALAEQRLLTEMAMLPDPPFGLAPVNLPRAWYELWDERVAIMMEGGKLPLEHAEAKALADVMLVMARDGVEPRCEN